MNIKTILFSFTLATSSFESTGLKMMSQKSFNVISSAGLETSVRRHDEEYLNWYLALETSSLSLQRRRISWHTVQV